MDMKKCVKIVCLLLTLVLMLSPAVHAAEQGSRYFSSYDAWIEFSPLYDWQLHLCFDVSATGIMDEIGVYSIDIMESTDGVNFTTVDTFYPVSFPEMMDYNSASHAGYVTFYNTVPGRSYKTYVTFWAELDGGAGMGTTYSEIVRVPN